MTGPVTVSPDEGSAPIPPPAGPLSHNCKEGSSVYFSKVLVCRKESDFRPNELGSLGATFSPSLPPPSDMSRIWKFIKENPYVSTALVFGSVGMYIYWDQRTRCLNKFAPREPRVSLLTWCSAIFLRYFRLSCTNTAFTLTEKKQAEMEERIRRNREDSERRDLARREAAAAAAASPSSVPKKGENSPLPEASTPTPPMPRIPSTFCAPSVVLSCAAIALSLLAECWELFFLSIF